MSRIVLVSVPLKKTDAVDVRKPIEKFVSTTFGAFTEENASAVEEFAKMREAAVLRTPDRHESGLEPLFKYYDQLSAMEAKLPISESDVRLKFTWYDPFAKKALFSGQPKQSLYSSAFERINVLFNVAALYSQIARIQNFESDEGLKAACKQFQSAAGIFRQVKDLVYVQMSSVPQPDLSSESLYALAAVMLAQAQESLYHKTILDQMKNPICAKVAAQTGDLYADAARLIADPTVAKRWDKDFTAIVTAKQSYFLGMAEFHQGQECKANAKHGESIARYRLAYGYVNDAAKKGETFFQPGDVLNRIGRELSQAEKDNNVIYSDLIPAPHQMDPIGRAALAKATPLAFPASPKSHDLFAGIVPKTIHDAVARYESQREALVQTEVGKLRESTQMLNGTLSSLNLPAAIEDTSGDELPASLLTKAEAVRTSGGVERVTSLLRELPKLQQRNKEVLNETSRMMAEEEQSDTAMRERFQHKWTRRPSADLFKEHRAEIAKYDAILTNATQADGIVRAKYDTHVNGMTLLSKSEAELIQSVPKGSSGGSSDSMVVAELKGLMERVNSLKASRETIEASLRDATVDISARFMSALEADQTLADESISEAQLGETYGPLQQQVADSVAQQQTLVESINAAHQRFISGGGAASAREGVLKDLAAAHDAFMELKENLQEGAKFYSDLTRLLLKSQSKVSDLIFARNTEKDDYVKELQRVLAKSDPAPTPSREAPQPAPRDAPPRPAPREAPRPTPRHPPERPPPPQQQQPQPVAAPPPPQAAASAPPPAYAPQAPLGGYGQAPPPPQGSYYQPNPYTPYPVAPTYGGPPPQGSYPGYQGYQQPPAAAPPPGQYYPPPRHGYQYPPQQPPYGYQH